MGVWGALLMDGPTASRANTFMQHGENTLDDLLQRLVLEKADLRYHEVAIGGEQFDGPRITRHAE